MTTLRYDIYLNEVSDSTVNVVNHTGRTFDNFDDDKPRLFKVQTIVETPELAAAIVSKFPKSVGLKSNAIGGSDMGKGVVYMDVWLSKDGVNKGVNETGIKRIKSFLKTSQNLGIVLEKMNYGSNYSIKTPKEYGWF